MGGRYAAAAAARRAALNAASPGHAAVPSALRRPSAPQAAAALGQQQRGLAAGQQFNGFFGGGGGGFQQPPRGDSEKLYKLLGVDKGADDAAIKSAYKKQAMKHHPDRGGDEGTFKEISHAYEVLSNPEKRQVYDMYGEEGLQGMDQGGAGAGPAVDPFDLFQQMFGFAASPQGRRRRPVTPDSTYELQLTLEELYSGTTRSIAFTREALCQGCKGYGGVEQQKCPKCKGSGSVIGVRQTGTGTFMVQQGCPACASKGYVIPPGKICEPCQGRGTQKEKTPFTIDVEPGTKDGAEFRFPKQADEAPGHDTGDVVIVVRQRPHKVFQRMEDSLVMAKKITLAEALCGFEFSTTFLDGKELVIRSAPGQVVRPGDMLKIEGKGMPRANGQRPGKLYVALDVDFPERLAPAQQSKLAEVLGGVSVADLPPPLADAEVPRKLNRKQTEDLRQSWAMAAEEARNAQEQQGKCVHQ